jgi:zinc transport system permease protein
MPDVWLADLIQFLAQQFGTDLFVVRAFLTLIVLCLLCGMVGSLVVGN